MQLIIMTIQLLVSQTRYLNPQQTLKLRRRQLLKALTITPTQWLRIMGTSTVASSTGLQTNETFPSPFFQPHINHSPNAQMQQPQGSYASSNHAYSSNPPQTSSLTYPSWRINSPHPRGYSAPQGVGFPSPQTHFANGSGQGGYPSPGSSPHFTNNPGRGSGRGYPSPGPNFRNSPHFANSPGHGPGHGYLSPGPNFRNSPNHGSGQGGYPSSGPSSGRGRGGGPGQGGGQGRGHNHVSAEDWLDRFYNKSTVEDPWKFLEPVIWKSLKKQWFQPVNAKKPRVSESPRMSSSQPSLAEILVASLNEATDDKPNAE
ncbi:protein SICKLE [Helianthus annuus]|uniref:protein SICKLE n=1 Tax=Helianthus annuus TaxID=4232 RepID=UPI000B8FE5F8|nr:protein SICKLE [Helianthus annuus]